MLVVILTMTTFVLDIIKGVKAIASGMHAIIDSCVWRLLLPVVYNRPKVGITNRLDCVSLDGLLMEYDSATCYIIDVYCFKKRQFITFVNR